MNDLMSTRMKRMSMLLCILLMSIATTFAQKMDEERMRRDIEVASNVLATLIKQQLGNQRTFFPLEVKGNYQAGYGVTFTLPADYTTPIALTFAEPVRSGVVVYGSDPGGFSYSFDTSEEERLVRGRAVQSASESYSLAERAREKKRLDMDSIRNAYNDKVIEAAKLFILDYSDMITQLGAQERITITNQGTQPRVWVAQYFNNPKRTHLSIEALRSDMVALKQGKLTREQAMNKIKVVNTETMDTAEPDLELLSSILTRLYRQDLATTFFADGGIYYERLKDFGAIFYMQVYSSRETDFGRVMMPTLGLADVDTKTRDKKVTEMYPKFEQEVKENLLEYGRTVKSLKDDEVLVLQVKVTKCVQCGIPSTLEYSVKGAVLKDYSSGKLDKNNALSKISVKKGPNQ